MVKLYRDVLSEMKNKLLPSEGDKSGRIARELLAFAGDISKERLLSNLDIYVSEPVMEKAEQVLSQYLSGMPLAYIIGQWSFFGLPLKITPDVLIPRDDTMVVTALALEQLGSVYKPRILDLCTGSGCIGLAIAAKRVDARVTLTDVSEKALRVAKENITLNHLSARVTAVSADVLQPVQPFLGAFDLIVSNPPYITEKEMKELPVTVKNFEPELALYGGTDGLDYYRAICRNYLPALKDGGYLCFEFGMGQEKGVDKILRDYNMDIITYCRDTGNIIRAVAAQK